MDVPTFLDDHQTVLEFFGYWPSFHDANVISYTAPTTENQEVTLTLHTWEMTSDVDAKGYFVLRKHALISFHFTGVQDASLDRFDSGNILFGMNITRGANNSSFQVELDSVMDMSGSFTASIGEVVSLVQCTHDGKAI
jgi:hypothetical protein